MILRNQNLRAEQITIRVFRKTRRQKFIRSSSDLYFGPRKNTFASNKTKYTLAKNSYDQPNLAPWFNNPANHNKYDWYVFNSHWTYEKFRDHFKIPTNRCVVIKNGIDQIEQAKPYVKDQPIRIIHQNTPWRGLSVGAMQLVKNPLVTLDVYSSTEVYGKQFYDQNDHEYKELYEQAEKLPNVNYLGYRPNQYIKDNLKTIICMFTLVFLKKHFVYHY